MKENNNYLFKKQYEIGCTACFFKNAGIKYDNKILEENLINTKEDDPVDIYYLDKKFQVTFSDGRLEGERRKIVKSGQFVKLFHSRGPEEVLKKAILGPIIKKGKNSTKRISLLIDVININGVPFIGEEWFQDDFKNFILGANLGQYLFGEIILVCPNKNYKLFPLEND